MNLRTILVVLALGFWTLVGQAHDFVTERAWVEDPAGTMTLAEAQQAKTTPFENKYFTRGFSQSTFWLRLRIDPDLEKDHSFADKLVIRIRPPYQDQVRLFDPLSAQDHVRQTGDYFDWAHDEYRSLNLNFVIPVGDAPRDVWLRLRTDQSTMTVVEVMSENETRAADRRQEMGTTLYFAVLLVCMGWGLLSYLNHRDRLVGIYIVRELLAIAYAMVMLGYCRVFTSGWLPEGWLDALSNNIVWIFVAYVIWFDTQLIREFKPHPGLLKVLQMLPFILPLNLFLFLWGKTYLANLLNGYLVIVAIFMILFTALTTRAWEETRDKPEDEQPVFSKAFLVSIYSVVLLVVLINRLPIMGYAPAQDGFLYLNLFYAVLSSIAMMILIQVRAHRLGKRQQEALHRLELAKLEAEQERAQRVEQSNFLKMLAHEMKTPLSVVRMTISADHPDPRFTEMADRAVQDMNGIIERLLEVEKLNDKKLSIHQSEFDLVDMIRGIREALPSGLLMTVMLPDSLKIKSDARFVQIILSNLMENALKYGASDQPIEVKLQLTEESWINISICNLVGSAGVPDPEQVFNKYYRAPGAHERTGSGLGLYLSKALVELLHGHIRFSADNGRICFDVDLPAVSS